MPHGSATAIIERMRRRELGFGYQVDGLAMIAATAVLIAFVLPSMLRAALSSTELGIALGLLAVSSGIGTGIALMRGWHGLGFVLALGQWLAAAIGFGIAIAAGVSGAHRWWLVGASAVLGPPLAYVLMEVRLRKR